MDKYESLGIVGEGSYGVVVKCRHKESGQIVAIKKFLEGEEDAQVKKIAMREVRMLKRLRHENLVNLIEVFRRRRRLCLVLEFVESTVLDLLEAKEEGGLEPAAVRSYIFQLLRGLEFCHTQNIIHRDIKPENVLISNLGVVKLCDFGFARPLAGPGENCTDYVATRWYRAPELLVGDTRYGREVDVWAAGCLFAEMLTGDPLFPGDSDIDQLYLIIQTTGPLSKAHVELMSNNPALSGLRLNTVLRPRFSAKFPQWPELQVHFLQDCLEMDPQQRPGCRELLQHDFFTHDQFPQRQLPEIKRKIQQSQARISVGRLVGSQRPEPADSRPEPSTAIPPIAEPPPPPPPPAAPSHGWVKDTLIGWGVPGLASDPLTALLHRSSERPRPLAPVAGSRSPAVLRRGRETPACSTCQEVTARGHAALSEKLSPRLATVERALQQRRTSEARARPGLSLPNVPGAGELDRG
ncbi:cyclin-dependent kinase-like 1 [Pollicipes pollicipes]|uniref:cyclin-dependent kinase-like 1 n=1 Tax=Pollicipes pollicipes TaxID=41117 RepID=UPI001884EFA0|nr:cyclin-dependent kinase-like 1 [Pollicipes pollicipes]